MSLESHTHTHTAAASADTTTASSDSPILSTAASTVEGTQPSAVEDGGPSTFVFPSYDDFVKGLDDIVTPSDTVNGSGENSNSLDEVFAAFQNELSTLSATNDGKRKGALSNQNGTTTTTEIALSADEQCARLTAQVFSNPFQVFQLPPEASTEDIKRQYRKISLSIHPDKCHHPKAREAFQVLLKAYEELQRPEMRKKYETVIDEAKKRVIKERVKENRRRKISGISLLPEKEEDLRQEIMEMCDKILAEQDERRKYAEACKAANERYEKEQEMKLLSESLNKRDEKRKWEESRDERVNSWRSFKDLIQEKKVKVSAFGGIRHQKEQRHSTNDKYDAKLGKAKQGLDDSYKVNWR